MSEIPPKTSAVIESPLGRIQIEARGDMLNKLRFVNDEVELTTPSGFLSHVATQLHGYFQGKLSTFDLPLLAEGTHFQRNVWDELQHIPFGQTLSYELLARRLGDIKVIRAAATANGRNPIAIIIPCHRVVGKDGSLTGYSGGLWRKQYLLELEQRSFQPRLL
ncbi:MAG: methylated-DNA--[protein]-cysteine S-methyltransferase [Flavobacteriales bacterium]